MMDIPEENNPLRLQLNHQQLTEWTDNTALEVKTRLTLDERHHQEQDRLAQGEINFHERTALLTRQKEELSEFKHLNSQTRIALKKRHAQEQTTLSQIPDNRSSYPPITQL